MTMSGKTVSPDKRKGMVYIYQSDDALMHFCWRERTKNTAEDDLIIFPDDVEYKAVTQCTTGRVFLLKFKSNSRKMFFWMQEPKSDKDEELCCKLNEYLNNPPAPGSSRSGDDNDLSNILGSMNQQQLMQLLGGMGGMPSLSSLMGGRSASALSDSTPPSRVQSSPGTRSGAALDQTAAPHRPQTAASTLPSTASTSVQPSTTPSTTGMASTQQPAASNPPAAATAPAATPAAASALTPRIQLADLQTILSGFDVMDESSPMEVDLSSTLTAEAMIPILANADVQERLIPLLPEAADLPKTEEELRATVHSPQFHQALQSFSSALSSGQLGPLMRQFGLDDTSVAAASGGDMLAFARAMQEALAKKRDGNETKPADDS